MLRQSSNDELYEKESQNLLNLLYTVAEDQAKKDGYVHRGITCNSCQVSPIRGLRYKCANCVDYDQCETCESQNRHIKTHVFIKIRIPIPPLANPRSALLLAFYPGGKNEIRALTWEVLRQLQKDTHFDQVELEALYEQYKSLSTADGPEGGIEKETFEHSLGPLGSEKNLVTERIFKFFDKNGDGLIDFSEMVGGMSVLCKGTTQEKLKYTFEGLDLIGNNHISRDSLRKMYKAYFYLSMELVNDVIRGLEEEMMDGGSSDEDDVTVEQLEGQESMEELKKTMENEVEYESQFGTFKRTKSGPSSCITGNDHTSFNSSHAARRQSMQYAPGCANATSYGSENINNIATLANGIRRRSGSVCVQRVVERNEPWPAMEAMSQDAINQMVDTAFKCADTNNDGLISFEEFKRW
eukprot:Ihof_evm3s21 gene=Ihof_evmTU3s21